MKNKILVTVRQFKSGIGNIDVDSRLFDGETKQPIIVKYESEDTEFHLGQVSSNLAWAVQDIPDQDRTAKKELDKLYPDGFEFEFYYLTTQFIKEESKRWWESLSTNREEIILNYHKKLFFETLPKEELKNIDMNKISRQDITEMWVNSDMIYAATKKLKPVDTNNLIY